MNRQRSKQKICIHASRARLISHCLFSIIFPVPFFFVVFFAIYLNIIIVFKHTVVDRNIRTAIANDRSTYPRSLTHSSVVSKSCKFHFSPANCVHAHSTAEHFARATTAPTTTKTENWGKQCANKPNSPICLHFWRFVDWYAYQTVNLQLQVVNVKAEEKKKQQKYRGDWQPCVRTCVPACECIMFVGLNIFVDSTESNKMGIEQWWRLDWMMCVCLCLCAQHERYRVCECVSTGICRQAWRTHTTLDIRQYIMQ